MPKISTNNHTLFLGDEKRQTPRYLLIFFVLIGPSIGIGLGLLAGTFSLKQLAPIGVFYASLHTSIKISLPERAPKVI